MLRLAAEAKAASRRSTIANSAEPESCSDAAQRPGEIDAYPEYTGTITAEILAGQNVPDETTMRDLLREKGIGVSKSLGFSNSYALALTQKRAAELRISRNSDLKRLPELRLALTHEFLDRRDGWSALARHYDLEQRGDVVGVDHDIAYRQLLAGEIDVVDVYSTDAMIRRGSGAARG